MSGGDVLLLGGDITCARFFIPGKNDGEARGARKNLKKLGEVSKRYDRTYYIMGNHEHYGSIIYESPEIFTNWFEEENIPIEVLDDVAVRLNKSYDMFAGTLWTDFNKSDPTAMYRVQSGMNDYRIIYKCRPDKASYVERKQTNDPNFHILHPLDTLEMHGKTRNSIANHYDNVLEEDRNLLVLTHHAPSFASNGPRTTGIESGYCSDLSEFILNRPRITHWIHGHTHYNTKYEIGNCSVSTAMYGYAQYEPYLTQNFKLGELEI